jgi:hypothetical protein
MAAEANTPNNASPEALSKADGFGTRHPIGASFRMSLRRRVCIRAAY